MENTEDFKSYCIDNQFDDIDGIRAYITNLMGCMGFRHPPIGDLIDILAGVFPSPPLPATDTG